VNAPQSRRPEWLQISVRKVKSQRTAKKLWKTKLYRRMIGGLRTITGRYFRLLVVMKQEQRLGYWPSVWSCSISSKVTITETAEGETRVTTKRWAHGPGRALVDPGPQHGRTLELQQVLPSIVVQRWKTCLRRLLSPRRRQNVAVSAGSRTFASYCCRRRVERLA